MNKHIIIIGAGASGLAAASRLVKMGINSQNLTVLEAQARIGGRIHTIIEDGNQLEIGAQWVHGEVGNVVFSMASAKGELNTDIHTLQSSGLAEDVVFKFQNEAALSKGQLMEFAVFIDSILEAPDTTELAAWTGSLGEYATKKFEEGWKQGILPSFDRETALAMLDWYLWFQTVIDGADNSMLTCGAGHTHYHQCEGDPLVTWKRGYSCFFNILMKDIPMTANGQQLPLSDRILLNKAVRKIDWDVVGQKGSENQPVSVTCEDGSVYRADFVLITCSLGFLKAEAERLFTPALPPQKMRAIEGLGFGTVDKVFLKFQRPWWTSDWGGVSLLRRRDEAENASSPPHWSDNILGFYTVRLQPHLLVIWLTGPTARHVETLPDDQVMKGCSDCLHRFVRSDFPDYTEPVAVIRSKWFSNPFFKGSYSYRSTRSSELNVWASDLAQPVCDSTGRARLFFAGEATHDHFYSTVHGAVESGFREGERIAKYCNGVHNKL